MLEAAATADIDDGHAVTPTNRQSAKDLPILPGNVLDMATAIKRRRIGVIAPVYLVDETGDVRRAGAAVLPVDPIDALARRGKVVGVLSAMGGKPKLVGEAIGGALTFDKTIYAYSYGSILGFLHGAAICHAAGLSLETYVEQVVGFGAGSKPRLGEMLVKQSYEASGATMEIEAAAYGHVVRLIDELGLDATFSTAVSDLFERAMADGLGEQGIAAMFKVLIKKSG